jgi:hypothetical protein
MSAPKSIQVAGTSPPSCPKRMGGLGLLPAVVAAPVLTIHEPAI